MNICIAASTQMAVDSIGIINKQIAAIEKIHIDPGISPSLNTDIHELLNTTNVWKNKTCPQVRVALQDLLPESKGYKDELVVVGSTNQQALLDFAIKMQKGISVNESALDSLNKTIGPLRMSVDKETSNLHMDLGKLNTQLQSEHTLVINLENQIGKQRKLVKYYNTHPWKLVLDGLTIVGLIKDLTDLIAAEKNAAAALSQLKNIQPKLQQLQDTYGPLLCLSTAISGLGAALNNMQTAVEQVLNILEDIVEQPPLAAIIFEQMETVIDDLQKAEDIATEILSGSE